MRGFGLPGCGRGVTVPTSTKPKPSRAHASRHSPFLSSPAARPTRLAKRKPSSSPGSSTAACANGSVASFGARRKLASVSSCARSASSRNSSERASSYIGLRHSEQVAELGGLGVEILLVVRIAAAFQRHALGDLDADLGQCVELARVVGHQTDLAQIQSEEHTSELQSLMRISYAVFCLKKKNTKKTKNKHITYSNNYHDTTRNHAK